MRVFTFVYRWLHLHTPPIIRAGEMTVYLLKVELLFMRTVLFLPIGYFGAITYAIKRSEGRNGIFNFGIRVKAFAGTGFGVSGREARQQLAFLFPGSAGDSPANSHRGLDGRDEDDELKRNVFIKACRLYFRFPVVA